MPEMDDRRNLSVWAGLDELGTTVVDRLRQWTEHEELGESIAEVNRVLPRVDLPSPDLVSETALATATETITEAIGELLIGPFAQRALLTGEEGLLVTHVWLVLDSRSPVLAILPVWLPRLYRRFDALHVQARVHLVLRHGSWALSDSQQLRITQQMRATIEAVAMPGTLWAGLTTIFVVTDRTGRGGRLRLDATTASICSFIDLIVLGGITPGQLAQSFAKGTSILDSSWDGLPIFGSFSSRAMAWNEAEIRRRAYADQRRERLLEELRIPVPRTFTPDAPSLPILDGAGAVNWPAVGLPKWSPRLWQEPRSAYADADRVLSHWLLEAKRWRHAMLVSHEDSRAYLEHQAAAQQRDYIANLDDATRTLLEYQTLPGYFSLVSRVLERANAELMVAKRGVPRPRHDLDSARERFNPSTSIPLPATMMKGADQQLIERLERLVNMRLLTIVTAGTFVILLGWTFYGAVLIRRWIPSIPSPSGTSATASPLEQFKNWLLEVGAERLPRIQDALPTEWQVGLWAAGIYGLILACAVILITWRQRIALERAWSIIFKRARTWRDETAESLAADLKDIELTLQHEVVDALLAEVKARSARLKELERRLAHPERAEPDADIAITTIYPKDVEPPPPLTANDVDRIMMQFRKTRAADPAIRETPERVVDELTSAAAFTIGDPDIDLVRAVREDMTLLNTILTMIPPELAVQLQPKDPTAFVTEGTTVRLLGMPESVHPDLARVLRGKAVLVRPMQVENRFYGAVLQSEQNARRIFGSLTIQASEIELDPIEVVPGEDTSSIIHDTLAGIPDAPPEDESETEPFDPLSGIPDAPDEESDIDPSDPLRGISKAPHADDTADDVAVDPADSDPVVVPLVNFARLATVSVVESDDTEEGEVPGETSSPASAQDPDSNALREWRDQLTRLGTHSPSTPAMESTRGNDPADMAEPELVEDEAARSRTAIIDAEPASNGDIQEHVSDESSDLDGVSETVIPAENNAEDNAAESPSDGTGQGTGDAVPASSSAES